MTLLGLVVACALPLQVVVAADRSRSSGNRESNRVEIQSPPTPKVDYVLQPQDVLRVHVFQEESINKQCETLSVSQEYSINLPLIKTVSLRGKTVRQAEEMIRALYDADYLVNPQVSVTVIKYAERFVNVVGAVNKADRIPFPPERGLTILDAITAAGGQSRIADLKRVRLTRKGPDGETTTETIDVDAMMKNGSGDAIQLENNDHIFVPERIL